MRILIATGLYPPDIGGPATHSKFLFDELPKHGLDVGVVTFGCVRRLPKIIRHIVYFFYIVRQGAKADIIYALDPVSVGLPSMLAAYVLRKRFIVRVAGDYAWEQGTQRFGIEESLDTFARRTKGYPFFVRVLKLVQTKVASYAERVVVPSKYLARIVEEWGIGKGSIAVIYNSFELPTHLATKETLRELMKLKGFVIISSGRLVKWKGFRALIDVMVPLAREFSDVTLLIVGDGPDLNMLQARIVEKGMEKHVVLVGRLDKETLLRYIKAADIFVLNTFYEGFSHQLLEVMALGVPIVTTKVGGNPELVEHNKTALLVPYNDKQALIRAIANTFKNKKETLKRTEASLKRAGQFSKERAIVELLKILKT